MSAVQEQFPGYYRPTDEEFRRLWAECDFVLDASVLLNLYRLPQQASDTLMDILDAIQERLWIPHQAAWEYHRRRRSVIAQQVSAYTDIQRKLRDACDKLRRELQEYKRHPYIEVGPMLEEVQSTAGEIEKRLEVSHSQHPDLLEEDKIRDGLTHLFSGRVGSPYDKERLQEIYSKGEKRYKRKTPPGFEDEKKGDPAKYGDFVLWCQVIDHARETNTPCILVTDDRKEDWWWKSEDGKTIGPHPELVQEMHSEARVSFYMYRTDQFMQYAQKYLGRQDSEQAIEEARDLRQYDEHVALVRDLRMKMERSERLLPAGIAYQAHVQDVGWMDWVSDGETAGTTGQARRMEAIRIHLVNPPAGMGVRYQAQVEGLGWMQWVLDGETAGTTGRALRLQAVRIALVNAPPDCSLTYQAHVEEAGWGAWHAEEEVAGTTDELRRMEAIRIRLVAS